MNTDRNPEEDGISFPALALDAVRATAAPQLLREAPAGAIAAQDGDAVIGRLGDDQLEINVEFVASPAELEEYASELPSGAEVIYGRFPGRDNDGLRAVTIDLPDRDGVVRPHPH
jgi:hypothetical protein